MDMTLLSLNALPFLLTFFVSALILSAILYGHLNFKHIQIKNVSMVGAILMLPVAIFLTPLVNKMALDYDVKLLDIMIVFAGINFLLVLSVSMATPKGAPSIIQIIGVVVFGFGFYSLLA